MVDGVNVLAHTADTDFAEAYSFARFDHAIDVATFLLLLPGPSVRRRGGLSGSVDRLEAVDFLLARFRRFLLCPGWARHLLLRWLGRAHILPSKVFRSC